ncbi:unnamed protein product [Clonostachys rosea]|uniref:Neutral protease 2 n=1 Tax=Bionectria ochroleuca TaxID=29856 RepID=A0ABY6UZG5_BIOOC|nr:unnamed protein product [Clonostachys rosea]
MKFLLNLLSLASLVATSPLELRSDPSVELKIEKVGETSIKATVTSHHGSNLKLLKLGGILDDNDVEKANVFSGDNEIEFQGVYLYLDMGNLPESAFVNLPAGGTIEKSFEVARFHDLSAGGEFKIEATGFLQYAEGNSTNITGSIPYESNLVTNVNGADALGKLSAFKAEEDLERSKVNRNTCKGSKLTVAKNSLKRCYNNSKQSAKAARSGSASRMKEYFKSASSSTRKTVAGVFDSIAKECSSNTAGQIFFSCTNTKYCKDHSGVVAYAYGKDTVFCPAWFQQPVNGACHQGDKASVIIHEFSHSLKGTKDYNAYGYAALRRLPAAKNIKHADSYTYFSNAVEVNC